MLSLLLLASLSERSLVCPMCLQFQDWHTPQLLWRGRKTPRKLLLIDGGILKGLRS